MFGPLGVQELLLIFALILIVFGPRKIPEIGRMLGKAMGEFRKATDDLKNTIEREVRLEELKKITPPSLESFMTPDESVSRTEPVAPPPSAETASAVETPDAVPTVEQPELSTTRHPEESNS
jgi:TatA/E family protein of Tat protein translocase